MPRDARFWRNVLLIAVAHIAILIALVRWSHATRPPDSQSIMWMSSGGTDVAPNPSAKTETAMESTPPPETDAPLATPPDQDEPPIPTQTKSDLQLPSPTPSPTPIATPLPKPSLTPDPKSSPKSTPKPTPKATPKKTVVAKATPKPLPKKTATSPEPEKKNGESEKPTAKSTPSDVKGIGGEDSGSTGPGGATRASEFSSYGKMLHGRFYSSWIQPTTSVAVGAKMSALVRIRIEKDGRVSNFTIVRPSGNVVVDESVAAVAKRVTQVDPLPKGLGGAYYEVNINFELNPEP
jgi:TonB family protein